MTSSDLTPLLLKLVGTPKETEWVEFKRNNTNPEEIGEYLSAISNSAALHRATMGYIVWGVEDSTHRIVGTSFSPHKEKVGNEELESWLLRLLTPRIDFRIHEFKCGEQFIVIFEVPAASHTPVKFKQQEFVRIGSYKKRLAEFPEKERQLWLLLSRPVGDWSAQVCLRATLNDLDPRAITHARNQYKVKNPRLANEVDSWDDQSFLNKAKVCIDGQVTRTALILLGREEAEHHLSPSKAQITWVLKDQSGVELDYTHLFPPLILNAEEAFKNVRNLTYRYMRDDSLFPFEINKYDPWVIREALHNCIAHQDYTRGGRINLVEEEDALILTNQGHFLLGTLEQVIERDSPPEVYRNPFLANAMVSLNMIDTIGSGIKRMFHKQRKRFFPLPDYDLSDPERVRVRITGKVLDENYTRVLMSTTDLSLAEVIALDKTQKRLPLTDEEFRSLKARGLVEGRRPNLFVSAKVAAATDERSRYIKLRGLDNQHYKELVILYLCKFGRAKRQDLEELLLEKIADALTDGQKRRKIGNLLQEMARQDKTIRAEGATRAAAWLLTEKGREKCEEKSKLGRNPVRGIP